MKKVWKAGIAGLAALSIGAAGFIGTTAAFADPTTPTTPTTTTASTTSSITVNDTDEGRTYNAYQIFKGKVAADHTLSDIEWGANITAVGKAALINAINTQITDDAKKVAADAAAKDVAKALGDLNLTANSEGAKAIAAAFVGTDKLTGTPVALAQNEAKTAYTAADVTAGYYLIKDETPLQDAVNKANSSFILQVTGATAANVKRDVPTVDKQVEDEKNDGTTGNEWGDSADHAVGEEFRFKLDAKLPASANRADYATYKVVFHDTMSEGLTWNSVESVKINVDGVTDAITVPEGKYSTADTTAQTGDENAGKTIWTLTIPNIVAEGLVAKAHLTKKINIEVIYKAKLNEKAFVNNTSGATANKNKVYLEFSNNPYSDSTGKTQEKDVVVFTYKIKATKVDGDGNKLAGAGFKVFPGSHSGKDVPTGVNALKFTWNAEKSAYVLDPTNGTEEIFSKDGGNFSFQGLEEGTYTVVETTVPETYNQAANTIVTLSASHTNNAVTIDSTSTTEIEVENVKGSQLPATGGMGTTMLYVAGGAIVLIAGIGMAVALRRRQA